MLTIPQHLFVPWKPPSVAYIKGQMERGQPRLVCNVDHGGGQAPCGPDCYRPGYLHWQILVCFSKKIRLAGVKAVFGAEAHAELTRSEAADDYVWKEETRIAGTQFEIGQKDRKRNSADFWKNIKTAAKEGRLDEIDDEIYIRHYSSLRRIAYDNMLPRAMERKVFVFWGATGLGKSRRAWEEAGLQAYPKDPRTKFWDGYKGQEHVVMDEFRGDIDIAHLLRWFDRYPVNVEIKGSAVTLCATSIWITSNIAPRDWFPNIDEATMNALLRRLTVVHFQAPFGI